MVSQLTSLLNNLMGTHDFTNRFSFIGERSPRMADCFVVHTTGAAGDSSTAVQSTVATRNGVPSAFLNYIVRSYKSTGLRNIVDSGLDSDTLQSDSSISRRATRQ